MEFANPSKIPPATSQSNMSTFAKTEGFEGQFDPKQYGPDAISRFLRIKFREYETQGDHDMMLYDLLVSDLGHWDVDDFNKADNRSIGIAKHFCMTRGVWIDMYGGSGNTKGRAVWKAIHSLWYPNWTMEQINHVQTNYRELSPGTRARKSELLTTMKEATEPPIGAVFSAPPSDEDKKPSSNNRRSPYQDPAIKNILDTANRREEDPPHGQRFIRGDERSNYQYRQQKEENLPYGQRFNDNLREERPHYQYRQQYDDDRQRPPQRAWSRFPVQTTGLELPRRQLPPQPRQEYTPYTFATQTNYPPQPSPPLKQQTEYSPPQNPNLQPQQVKSYYDDPYGFSQDYSRQLANLEKAYQKEEKYSG